MGKRKMTLTGQGRHGARGWKKFFMILCSAFFLSGCGSQRLEEAARDVGSDGGAAGTDVFEEADGLPEGKELFYKEEEIPLPEEVSSSYADAVKLKWEADGLWMCVIRKNEGTMAWKRTADGWREATPDWFSAIEEEAGGSYSLCDYAEDGDGKRFCLFAKKSNAAEGQDYRLLEMDAEGNITEPVLDFSADLHFGRVGCLTDGTLALWDKMGNRYYLYPKGQRRWTELAALTTGGLTELPDGMLALHKNRLSGVERYDRAADVSEEWIDQTFFSGCEVSPYLLVRREDGWILINGNGIFTENEGKWQHAAEALRCSYTYKTAAVCDALWTPEGLYLATENQLYCYRAGVQDKVSQVTLRVTSAGAAGDWLKLAASRFMNLHPGVTVAFEELEPGEVSDAAQEEEAVRKLNTRIIAGERFDVLILNGLPWKEYGKKGVLLDLTALINGMDVQERPAQSILQAMRQEEKLPAIPTNFRPLLRMEDVEETADFSTIEGLYSYLKEEESHAGFMLQGGYFDPDKLAEALYTLYGDGLYAQTGSMKRENLTLYLECWKLLQQRSEQMRAVQEEFAEFSYSEAEYKLEQQAAGFAIFEDGCEMQRAPWIEDEGYKVINAGCFYPVHMLGIDAASGNLDMAKEFVRFCLSERMQQEAKTLSFPVQERAARKVMEKKCELCHRLAEDLKEEGKYELAEVYDRTLPENIGREWELVSAVDRPVEQILGKASVKPVLYQLFYERAKRFLKDEAALEETADAILSAVKMYEDEQR